MLSSLWFFLHFSLSAQKPLGGRTGCIQLLFRAAAVRHCYGNADYAGGAHRQLHRIYDGSAAAVYRQSGSHEWAASWQYAALCRNCFLCAAHPDPVQKPRVCDSVWGAEYVFDCHNDAKQVAENPVPQGNGNAGSQQARIAGTNPELREIPYGHGSVCRFRRKSGQSAESTGGVYRTADERRSSVHL